MRSRRDPSGVDIALQRTLRRISRLERRYVGVRHLIPPQLRRMLRWASGVQNEPSPRHYIPAELGVRDFFGELRRLGVDCVVLRWFDQLPEVAPGDDIDLLVADDDLSRLVGLLCRAPDEGRVPCDIYAVSGPPDACYQGMPYYPPCLSRQILSRSVEVGELCRVPCLEDHFLSLAYHALYQKGPDSGLPTATPGVATLPKPKHDYVGVLAALAAKLTLQLPITMEALDEALAERGWRPPPQMLMRLAEENRWIRRRFSGELARQRRSSQV